MTEEEWLTCTDPMAMLAFLRRSTHLVRRRRKSRQSADSSAPTLPRKISLFVAACLCRSPSNVGERLLFQEYERYCDGVVAWAAVEEAYRTLIEREQKRIEEEDRKNNSVSSVHWMGPREYLCDTNALVRQAAERVVGGNSPDEEMEQERRVQCGFIRDIFNPFRPVNIAPDWLAWNDDLIVRLAQATYDDRDRPAGTLKPERLAILADALEEAGCTTQEILSHLRNVGDHVRGCWPIDLLLGRY
jgi:hypothetical protein